MDDERTNSTYGSARTEICDNCVYTVVTRIVILRRANDYQIPAIVRQLVQQRKKQFFPSLL